MCRRLLRDRALDSEYFSSYASVHLASSRLCLMLCEYLGRVGRVSLFRFLVPSLSLTNMTITCDSTAKAVSHKQLAKKIHKSSPPAVFHSSHPFPQHHFSRHHIFACAALQTPDSSSLRLHQHNYPSSSFYSAAFLVSFPDHVVIVAAVVDVRHCRNFFR